jgi:hypothetical protein
MSSDLQGGRVVRLYDRGVRDPPRPGKLLPALVRPDRRRAHTALRFALQCPGVSVAIASAATSARQDRRSGPANHIDRVADGSALFKLNILRRKLRSRILHGYIASSELKFGRDRTNKKSGPPAQGRRGYAIVKNRTVDSSVLHLLGAAAPSPCRTKTLPPLRPFMADMLK